MSVNTATISTVRPGFHNESISVMPVPSPHRSAKCRRPLTHPGGHHGWYGGDP